MSDYSKFLSNLTDQLGLLQGLSPKGFGGLGGLGNLGNNLGNLGNNLGNLPAHGTCLMSQSSLLMGG